MRAACTYRSQTLNGHPHIVTEMGLICSFGEIEYAFKANGRIPKLVRYQGVCGSGLFRGWKGGVSVWLVPRACGALTATVW